MFSESNYGSMQSADIDGIYQQAPLQHLPLSERVVKDTLDNGLTYYIFKTKENGFEGKAFLQLIQRTGSLVEDEKCLGVAHMVEHCAFSDSIWRFFKKRGCDNNATTYYNYTEYHTGEFYFGNDYSILDTCLLILRDFAGNCNFTDSIFERERKIILEEYRMRDYSYIAGNIGGVLKGTRYEQRPVLGTIESLNAMTLSNVRNYYNKWYQPQNQAFVAFGDVDVKQIEKKIRTFFGCLERGKSVVPIYEFAREQHTEPDVITAENSQNGKAVLTIFFSIATENITQERNTTARFVSRYIREQLARNIRQRLIRIQNDTMLFDDIEVNEEDINIQDDALFSISISCVPTLWRSALSGVAQELEKIKRYGWTIKETNKRFPENEEYASLTDSVDFSDGYDFSYSTSTTDYWITKYLNNFVFGDYLIDSKVEGALIKYSTLRISPGVIHDYFTKLSSDENTVILVSAPFPIEKSEILDTYNSARNSISERTKYYYAEDPNYQYFMESLSIDVTPGKTIEERDLGLDGCTEFTFDNGVKAVVSKKDCREYEFKLMGLRPRALMQYNDNDAKRIILLSEIMSTPFKSVKTDRINTELKYGIFYDEYKCTGISTSITAETWLKYIHFCLTDTTIDTLRFERCRMKHLEDLKTEKTGNKQIQQYVTKSWFDNRYESRTAPISEETLENLTIEDLTKLVKQYTSDYSGSVFFIHSEYSAEFLKPLLEKYLGSLPSISKSAKNTGTKAIGINCHNDTTIYHYNSSEPRADVCVSYALPDSYEYSQERIQTATAFSNILYGLLFNNIRQSNGSVYSFNINNTYSPVASEIITIGTSCSPANARSLLDNINTIVSKIPKGDLITETQVKQYIDNYKRTRPKKISAEEYYNILRIHYLNGGCGELTSEEKLVTSLTAEKIIAFAKELTNNGFKHETILIGE